MTTVDTSPLPSHWVERAEARADASNVDARRALLAVLFFIPMVVGVVVALVVRAVVFTYAAGREGYAIGKTMNLGAFNQAMAARKPGGIE